MPLHLWAIKSDKCPLNTVNVMHCICVFYGFGSSPHRFVILHSLLVPAFCLWHNWSWAGQRCLCSCHWLESETIFVQVEGGGEGPFGQFLFPLQPPLPWRFCWSPGAHSRGLRQAAGGSGAVQLAQLREPSHWVQAWGVYLFGFVKCWRSESING